MADDSPLTVDQAVNLLAPPPESAPEPAAEAVETEATEETSDLPTETEVEAASEAEEPGDGEEAEEPQAVEAAEAPTWWDAEKKAVWATLTPDQQAAVADQEAKRETVVARVKAESAEVTKQAQAEAAQAQGVLNALEKVVPQWIETFKSRWDNVDWTRWAAEDPAAYVAGRAEYEKERDQLSQAAQTRQLAEVTAQQAFYKERSAQLPLVAPELADPVKGEQRQTDLSQYLLKQGFDAETIRGADARMMAVAWKAHKYDQAQASFAKPKPAAAKPTVTPTAAPARTSQVRSVEQISARLQKSGSVEDAMALLQARRK